MHSGGGHAVAVGADEMMPWIEEPIVVAVPFVDDCECLSCLSDMKGIYPCLLEDDDER